MFKRGVSMILLAVLMAGCATMTDKEQTTAEGAGIGAVSGAVIGAGVGYATGGEEGAIKGALIGAGVGLIGGAVYGNHVANKKEEYATTEDYLDACILEAQKVNEETRQYNAALEGEVQDLDQEVTRLMNLYNDKQIAKTDLEEEQEIVQAKLDEAETQLQRARDEVLIQREVLKREEGQSEEKLVELEAQIGELEQTIAELDEQTESLASINDRMSI
jgi:uncharacterized protein YcfJ